MKSWALAGIVATGAVGMVGIVHGCTLNPWAGISYEDASEILGQPKTTSSSGGAGGASCICADDGNECTKDLIDAGCPNGDSLQCHQPLADQECDGGWCSNKGECTDCRTCTDAGTCTSRCDGVKCAKDGECKNGHCVDGICCNAECVGPCYSCNGPGVPGTCTQNPLGLQCGDNQVCDVNGDCVGADAALGALCTYSSDCTSGVCRSEYCRSDEGEPCTEHIECTSNLCDPTTKTCMFCKSGALGPACPTGATCLLPSGFCQVFSGQPATLDDECVPPATVGQLMCKLDPTEPCSRHADCHSNHCLGGKCAPPCTENNQCPTNACHSDQVCTLLAGEYCMEKKYCDSGICSGFPRKCQ
jgi:hypothetical protein